MSVLLVTGVLIGLVLGLTGAGGSVLALPLLVGLLHLPPAQAAGLSLGAVALAAWVGVGLRRGRQNLFWEIALLVGGAGAVLTPLGQWLARQLPATLLASAFAVLVVLIAWRMWRQAGQAPHETRILRAAVSSDGHAAAPACRFSASGQFEWRWPCLLRLLLVGALTGVLSGLFGVGGGFVIVPALVLLLGLNMVQAVATSLAIIALVALAGFAGFLLQAGSLPPGWSGLLLGSLGGMLLGTVVAPHLAGPRLQRIFVLLMLALAAFMLWQIQA